MRRMRTRKRSRDFGLHNILHSHGKVLSGSGYNIVESFMNFFEQMFR